MQENKQNLRFTALYCRLSSDDELKGDSNSIVLYIKSKSFRTMHLNTA